MSLRLEKKYQNNNDEILAQNRKMMEVSEGLIDGVGYKLRQKVLKRSSYEFCHRARPCKTVFAGLARNYKKKKIKIFSDYFKNKLKNIFYYFFHNFR